MKFFGIDEDWRSDGTGTKTLRLFFVPVWRWDFFHSSFWFD